MEVFYRVVKAGSFTKAEEVLNKSQSALSRSVAFLEEQLGVRLVDRKHKGLRLTRQGEEAYKIAQRMFMDMDGFKKGLSEMSGLSGKIRIATTYAIGAYILTDALVEFNKIYPDISFELIAEDSLIDLVQKEVDIGIRPYDSENPDLVQKHLFTIERGLFASKSYIDRYGEPKSLEDLENHLFIARSRPEENPYSDVGWALRVGRKNKDPRIPVFTSNSSESLLKAASMGVGITASHEEMDGPKRYGLVRIMRNLVSQRCEEYLVYPKHLQKVRMLKELESFLVKRFSPKKSTQS